MPTQPKTRNRVLDYVLRNPGANAIELCNALDMDDQRVCKYTYELCKEGKLIREGTKRKFTYTVSQGYIDSLPQAEKPESVPVIIVAGCDGDDVAILERKALELEQRGLFYRAATIWKQLQPLTKNNEHYMRVKRAKDKCYQQGNSRQKHRARALCSQGFSQVML